VFEVRSPAPFALTARADRASPCRGKICELTYPQVIVLPAVLRYRLDDLGWMQFEELCQSLLKACFAVGVQSWGGSGDHGRDAYFQGMLAIPDSSHLSIRREFVFQAKFVQNANASGAKPGNALRSAVRAEMKRVRDQPDCYVLMTNVPLGTSLRGDVEKIVAERLPNATVVVWGANDVCDLLDQQPSLRTSHPELLGLRELTALVATALTKPRAERARAFLERAKEVVSTFTQTRSYIAALERLTTHHLAVLSGPPEMGKTTTALVIGLAKHEEGWQCFDCRSPDDFFAVIDDEHPQLFVADDAFGTTEYKPRLAEEWAAALDGILRRLNSNHWFIWTSRTAPLERALKRMSLQGRGERFPQPGEVTVNASGLSRREKALMLYRHARAAGLDEARRKVIRANAAMIVNDDHFTPKRVQRFINDWLATTDPNSVSNSTLKQVIEAQIRTPTEAMRKSFDALPSSHKRFLVSMLDLDLADYAARYSELNKGEDAESPRTILKELSGHFLVVTGGTGERYKREAALLDAILGPALKRNGASISWTHPSWRDLVIDYLSETQEERVRFLETCRLDGFELALSTAGGAAGERTHPLLVNDADWRALDIRFAELARSLAPEDIAGLIVDIHVALPDWEARQQESTLHRWAASVLETARYLWREIAIPIKDIESYCDLSVELKPLAPLPDLATSWETTVRRVRQVLKNRIWEPHLGTFRSWLDLIELLQKNEPRLLEQVGHPSEYEGLALAAADALAGYVDLHTETDDPDEAESQIDSLQAIDKVAAALRDVFPVVTATVETVVSQAQARAEALQEGLDSRPVPPRPVATAHDERISIEELFRDL
jgi:hypothetical protein